MKTAAAHLEARRQDHTADMGNLAERVPNVTTNHRLAWLPDGQEIRSTDEITKALIVAGGEDTIEMTVSLIQALWEMEYKQWEVVVADIEVCMLYKGKGPRSLPQNDPEEGRRQRKNGQNDTNARNTPERLGFVSCSGHFEKTGGSDGHSSGGCDSSLWL